MINLWGGPQLKEPSDKLTGRFSRRKNFLESREGRLIISFMKACENTLTSRVRRWGFTPGRAGSGGGKGRWILRFSDVGNYLSGEKTELKRAPPENLNGQKGPFFVSKKRNLLSSKKPLNRVVKGESFFRGEGQEIYICEGFTT